MRWTLICSLLVGLTAACTSGTPAGPLTLTYGLTLVPTGIDPHVNASAELGIPLTSVYDTLVVQDPATHGFVPGLALDWDTSPDGRTYSFQLRTDVRFHDGSAFDAQAVCANLDRIADPANKSQKAVGMLGPPGNYQGCTVEGPHAVSVRLSQPYAPLLDSLSQVYFGMASPAALARWSTADYQFHQVGTGPFRFVEYVPGDHLTLERNPDYRWGSSLLNNHGPAHLERIVFRFYEDPATRAVALESGEVQVIGEVLPQDAARLARDSRFQLLATAIPGQPLQLLFNTQRAPTNDRRVREALLRAVDRPGLVSAVFGSYSPLANGPLTAVTFGYAARAAAPDFDLPVARNLLAEAGWADTDGDGVVERDGVDLSIDLVFAPLGLMPQAAQLVEANWKDLGARINSLQVPNFLALREAQATGEYSAIALNFFGSDPDLLRPWFASDGQMNWSKVSDPTLDDLLTQGYVATEASARAAIYTQVQQRITEEALIVPLRDYVNLNVASARVRGLRYNAQGWWPWLVDVSLAP